MIPETMYSMARIIDSKSERARMLHRSEAQRMRTEARRARWRRHRSV